MFISVIIPTYNRVDTLHKCLEYLKKQSIRSENFEIVIVDDCSKDNTPEFCKKYVSQNKNIKYIRNETNQGLATTRNIGIRACKGDLLVFLDNDLLVADDYLQTILEVHEKYKNEKIAVMSNITYQPEILKKTNFGTYIQSRAIGYRSGKDMMNIDYNDLPNNYFAGGGSTIKTKDAYSIGLFEEGLKKYGSEDELFGFRFKKSGGRIMFLNNAKIIHYDSNILPQYWRTKYIELGRYSLRTLREKEPELVTTSLYKFLMPVNKTDGLSTKIKKSIIKFASSSVFRVPVEKFVFSTDQLRFLNLNLLYRYLTVAWMKVGFESEKEIEEVKY